eukprot:gb/GECG01006159.1/.p1 GENE.gb/GECG01006159.1/~~gb/GECG01006159.1/.p1  ORF type:complete len:473 (+),score=77.15 gb/GECG01006159.1/:1-1419(+)
MSAGKSEEFMTGANAVKRHYFPGEYPQRGSRAKYGAIRNNRDTNDDEDPLTDGDSDDSNASLIVMRSANDREGGSEQVSNHGIPIRLRRSVKYSLALRGLSCTLFRNEKARSSVEIQHNLVPILGDESNLSDRFDVRHLLYSLEALKSAEPMSEQNTQTKTKGQILLSDALEKQRYKDILPETPLQSVTSAAGIACCCAGTDTTATTSSVDAQTKEDGSVEFVTPFFIPGHIKTPSKWAKHLRIAHTARKVHERPQLEVMLRVRQKENPSFSFLFDSDELFPYYTFLKKRAEDGSAEWPETPPDTGHQENPLGIGYSDSDEEQKEERGRNTATSSSNVSSGSTTTSSQDNVSSANTTTSSQDPNQEEKLAKIKETVNAVNRKLSERVGTKRKRWDADAYRKSDNATETEGTHEEASKASGSISGHEEADPSIASVSRDPEEEVKRQRRLARARMMKGHFQFRQETWSRENAS